MNREIIIGSDKFKYEFDRRRYYLPENYDLELGQLQISFDGEYVNIKIGKMKREVEFSSLEVIIVDGDEIEILNENSFKQKYLGIYSEKSHRLE